MERKSLFIQSLSYRPLTGMYFVFVKDERFLPVINLLCRGDYKVNLHTGFWEHIIPKTLVWRTRLSVSIVSQLSALVVSSHSVHH